MRTMLSFEITLCLALLAGALVSGLMACEPDEAADIELFKRAEALLAEGDYDRATQAYELFITEIPNGPLTRIAEQRLRNIDRELEAVMGRRSSPAPIYIRPPEAVELPSDEEISGTNPWDRSTP